MILNDFEVSKSSLEVGSFLRQPLFYGKLFGRMKKSIYLCRKIN